MTTVTLVAGILWCLKWRKRSFGTDRNEMEHKEDWKEEKKIIKKWGSTVAYGGPWVHFLHRFSVVFHRNVFISTVPYGGYRKVRWPLREFCNCSILTVFEGLFTYFFWIGNVSGDFGGEFWLKKSLENNSKHFGYVFYLYEQYHGCYDDSPSDV